MGKAVIRKVYAIEHHPNDSRIRIVDDGICQSLTGRMGTGGGNVPLVLMTYQKVTGTLSQGAHPAGFNGQDAYSDMLVTNENVCISSDRNLQREPGSIKSEDERLQGCDRPNSERGGADEM